MIQCKRNISISTLSATKDRWRGSPGIQICRKSNLPAGAQWYVKRGVLPQRSFRRRNKTALCTDFGHLTITPDFLPNCGWQSREESGNQPVSKGSRIFGNFTNQATSEAGRQGHFAALHHVPNHQSHVASQHYHYHQLAVSPILLSVYNFSTVVCLTISPMVLQVSSANHENNTISSMELLVLSTLLLPVKTPGSQNLRQLWRGQCWVSFG